MLNFRYSEKTGYSNEKASQKGFQHDTHSNWWSRCRQQFQDPQGLMCTSSRLDAMINTTVVGTGYVGLSTGVGLSELGHAVICADIDVKKIETLNTGKSPIAEAGMDAGISRNVAAGRLSFTTDVLGAVRNASIVFLCLPTPQGLDGSADLSFIETVAKQIGNHLLPRTVVVNKSTVPVGSNSQVAQWLNRDDVFVVSNPEFLRQGTALHDFLHPNRIVVGGDNAEAVEKVASLYANIDVPLLRMNADICELVGADIFDVVEGLGMDPRIGSEFLNPGPGWGGSCFPKDTRALVSIASKGGYDFALLRAIIEINDQHSARIAEKVIAECGGSVEGLSIAAWGLTFKANTDDLRDSPAIKILKMLRDAGAEIQAYDPTAKKMYEAYPWIAVHTSALEACVNADALVLLTEWDEFSSINPKEVADRLRESRVVDSRNILNKEKWISAGFVYRGVGR